MPNTKPPAGDAAIAKPTRMQRNQTHGISESIRPFPSHSVLPVIYLLYCLNPTPTPARKHIMPTRNEADGFLMRNKERNGKGTPGRAASPPTTMPDPPPSMQCTHHTNFCWSAVEACPPDVGGFGVDWYLPPECFVPRRISTSFYVGWPALRLLGPAGKPKRADVPPPDATHQNEIELDSNAQPAHHTLPRTTSDGTSKPAPEHVLTFPLGTALPVWREV